MENNYTVLARKYRSQDFDSLIGQEVLVKTLTTAINTGRIAHAYIFTGIRGTGKTSTARILAKALNCLSSDHATAKPCCKCENCVAIANGQHIDVMEIDAASHTSVDNMRDILDAALYLPTNARYKVYIIDEVHMLSNSAFNALLKTLEEPPAHVIFILATTEIRKVPITILSRCQRFDLARVSIETLKRHFAWIAEQENIELTDGANDLIARAADGSVRDGLSLLDQAIAQTAGHVDETAVLDMLKKTDRRTIVNFMKTLVSGNVTEALNKIDEMYNSGTDLTMLLNDMLELVHWATRYHPTIGEKDMTSSPYTADQREIIKQITEEVSLNTLSRMWQVMIAAVTELNESINQKQCFDMLIIRLMHIIDMPPISELLQQNTPAEKTAVQQPQQPTITQNIINITTSKELGDKLQESKELLLYSYFASNLEITEIVDTTIKYFDRKNEKDFPPKLLDWLNKITGKTWHLERQEQSNNIQTELEHAHSETMMDKMTSDCMSIFGAENLDIIKDTGTEK